MSLDKRSLSILNELITADHFLLIDEIAEKFKISKRTVYYDLEKIDSWLADYELEGVKKSYSNGLYLADAAKVQIADLLVKKEPNQYYLVKEERTSLISAYLILSDEKVTMNQLTELTSVSRITVYKDLKALDEELLTFNLKIRNTAAVGYFVEGVEKNIRKAAVKFLIKLIETQHWNQLSGRLGFAQNVASLEDYRALVIKSEDERKVQLTDEMISQLCLYLFVMCHRIRQGYAASLDEHEVAAIGLTPEYQAAARLFDRLSLSLSDENRAQECALLTIQLLGARVQAGETGDLDNVELADLRDAIHDMVTDFQHYACIFINDRGALEDLLFTHLKPAYYRIKYDIYAKNALTETIKQRYPDIFSMTKKSLGPIERLLNKKIDDDETAYISTYFGGWIRRQGTEPAPQHQAVIVCENGVGTSLLLQSQLEQLLPTIDIIGTVSRREYEKNTYHADLVFTTLPLQEDGTAVIKINPILTDEDKKNVLFKVKSLEKNKGHAATLLSSLMDTIEKHTEIKDRSSLIHEVQTLLQSQNMLPQERRKPMLHELLTDEMVQVQTSVSDWKDAIRTAAKPLYDHQYISEDYIDAMIKNVEELGPYIVIVPKIAIPHARPEKGVNQLGMSMLCLKEPVSFSEKENHQVQMVIVLAAIDNDTHLKALSQLTGLLSDQDKLNKIISTENKEEIVDIIKNAS